MSLQMRMLSLFDELCAEYRLGKKDLSSLVSDLESISSVLADNGASCELMPLINELEIMNAISIDAVQDPERNGVERLLRDMRTLLSQLKED